MSSPASTTGNSPTTGIDHVGFPDVVERILRYCDRETVFMLRKPECTSRLMFDLVNKHLFRHVAIIRVHENVHYKPKVETFQIVDLDGRWLPIPPFKCHNEDLAKRYAHWKLKIIWDLKRLRMLKRRRSYVLRHVRIVDVNSVFPACVSLQFPLLRAARIFHNGVDRRESTEDIEEKIVENRWDKASFYPVAPTVVLFGACLPRTPPKTDPRNKLPPNKMVITFLEATLDQDHRTTFDKAWHGVRRLDIVLTPRFLWSAAMDSLPRFLKAACGGGTAHNVRLVGLLEYLQHNYMLYDLSVSRDEIQSLTVRDFLTRKMWGAEESAELDAGRGALFDAIDGYQVPCLSVQEYRETLETSDRAAIWVPNCMLGDMEQL